MQQKLLLQTQTLMLLQAQAFGAANTAEIAALDADFDAASGADF